MEYTLVSHTKPGRSVSGDTGIFLQDRASTLAGLIDGLGSGEAAHHAATLARACIVEHWQVFLPDLLGLCHQALRGTRGAVIMLMRVDHLQNKVSFAGVGNVGVRVFSDTPIKPLSRNGIVGFRMANVREYSYAYTPGDVFVLYSDGISTRFAVDEKWARDQHTDLQEVAEQIVENYGKEDDDITVMVVR